MKKKVGILISVLGVVVILSGSVAFIIYPQQWTHELV